MNTPKSSEVAKAFGITQRQARNWINAGDPRLEPVNREALLRFSKMRMGAKCCERADDLSVTANALDMIPDAEVAGEDPAVARLTAIARRLRRAAGDLNKLAHDLAQ